MRAARRLARRRHGHHQRAFETEETRDFRVHDVAINRDALAVTDAMLKARDAFSGRAPVSTTYTIPANCAFFARHGVHDEEVSGPAFLRRRRAGCRLRQCARDGFHRRYRQCRIAFTVIEEIVTEHEATLSHRRRWRSISPRALSEIPAIKRAGITVRGERAGSGAYSFVQVSVEHFCLTLYDFQNATLGLGGNIGDPSTQQLAEALNAMQRRDRRLYGRRLGRDGPVVFLQLLRAMATSLAGSAARRLHRRRR